MILSPAARRLLWVNGLFALGSGLSGLFTNVYLFRLRPGFATPAAYNLFVMLAILVALPALGWLVRRRGAVPAAVLGSALHAGFYLTLLVLQGRAVGYLPHLGLFMGVAISAWALATHVLAYDVTDESNREAFYNRSGLVGSLAGVLAPLTAGWVVALLPGLTGYRVIFLLSFLLFGAATWMGLGLHVRRPPEPYQLGLVLPGRDPGWHRLMAAYLILGLREGVFSFGVSLLVYLSAKSGEAGVGNFAFLTSAVGLLAFWVAGRRMTPANRDRLFPVGAALMAAASLLLGLGVSWGVLLAHGLLQAVANPLWSTAFAAASFAVIRRAGGARDLRVEMIAAREIPLNLGRVLTLLLFLRLAPGAGEGGADLLRWLLASLGLAFPAAWLLVRRHGAVEVARTGAPVAG